MGSIVESARMQEKIAPSITILKDNPDIAAAVVKCKPGERITIEATVAANDESGLVADVDVVTPEYAREKKVVAKKESPTAYAKRIRRERMMGGKASPMMEAEV